MEHIVSIGVGVVTSTLCLLVGILIERIRTLKKEREETKIAHEKENDTIKTAIKAMLLNNLKTSHEFYCKRGYCSLSNKEEVTELYKCYADLGGNGLGTHLYEDIIVLPSQKQ